MKADIDSHLRAESSEPCTPVILGQDKQESAGLWLTEMAHPARLRVPMRFHEAPSFYMILEGSLTDLGERNQRHLTPGTVVFMPAGEIQFNVFGYLEGRCFLVELMPSWMERLGSVYLNLNQPIKLKNSDVEWLVRRLYREFKNQDDMSPLRMEGLTLQILSKLNRSREQLQMSTPIWLRTARELLHDRFCESIRLEDIAVAVGVHPVHLSRIFRQRYSCSFGEYRRRLRVEHACNLLRTTKWSIAQIAVSSGFADQAHLSKVFKRLTGMTPMESRQLLARGFQANKMFRDIAS